MATQKCVENIKRDYPGFGPCTDPFCQEVSKINDTHCLAVKPPLNPDDPIGPSKDPNLNGPGKPGYCYCCCSCFGSRTPIEVRAGEYALARDISAGEAILTAGADLRWAPRVVESASTWDSADEMVSSMYFLRYRFDDEAEHDIREVMVSPDHLFLVEDGTLAAVQNLTKKPLALRRADGGLSEVVVVAQGTYQGGVTTIQMEGRFDGANLTGHLLNTNGLVSADYKVQVHYAAQRLAPELIQQFTAEQDARPGGTPDYHEAFPDDAYARFVDDPADWPQGFTPSRRADTEARVPPHAARYLTDEQARDIRGKAPKVSAGDTFAARRLLYLFSLLRGLYPEVDFILDWDTSLPNAYSWNEWGRRAVVVTGGLVRLTELGRDGLALVVSAMVSYQAAEVRCVGQADYEGISTVMRRLWDSNLFVTVVESALPQIEKIFSYISAEHARPDPRNVCQEPGIACRVDSYNAGLSMFPVPECATPRPAYFEVRDARAFSPTTVQLTFSRTLDVPTAQTTENYAFEPATDVLSATVNPGQRTLVVLEVGELAAKTTYLVRVSGVVSDDDVPLDPAHSTGAFTTK